MKRLLSQRAKTRRAWRDHSVSPWGKWSMVRAASWPGRLRGRGMGSSLNAGSCLRSGVTPGRPPGGARAQGPIPGHGRRSRHGRRRWCRVSRRQGACLAGPASLIGCMAIVPMFGRRWLPGWGPRPSWPALRRRAAGSSGRERRSSPRSRRGQCGRRGRGCQRRSLHRASQRWPHPSPRGRGSGGRSRKGPKGPWRMPLRVSACPEVRTGCPSARSGEASSGPVALSRPMPMRGVRPRPVRRFARGSGAVVCGGPWTSVVRKRTQHAAGRTMKGGNRPAGSPTGGSRCWRMFFSGTCRSVWGKKASALTVSQLRRFCAVVFPLHPSTIEESLAIVAGTKRRTHQAYRAHRKRRETEG